MNGRALAAALLLFGCGSSDDASDSDGGDGGETGDPAGPIAGLSDEFDDPGTLSTWTLRHEAEGTEAQYSTLDIDGTTSGQLTWVPDTSGWFGDFVGPLLFKTLAGDFVIETSVVAGNTADPDMPPTRFFNSAGLMVRDPSSADGPQNYVMHNVGFQSNNVATEGKSTVDSDSMLKLQAGPHRGLLRLCRVGTTYVLTRQLDGESAFEETHRYNRGDIASTVQVGLILNGWNGSGGQPDFDLDPDLHATFDYVRFSRPGSLDDCAR